MVTEPGTLDCVRYRLGFTVDIVSYSSRTIDAHLGAQQRLLDVFHDLVAQLATPFDPQGFQATGDGFNYFVPDSDVRGPVHHLLLTLPRLLAEDNRAHKERMRLRMAIDIGTFGVGPLGFIADAVIRFSRLVDSAPIRQAVEERADADMVVIVSDAVYNDVVRRFEDFSQLQFRDVTVEVKDYRAAAHLLVCS